MKKNIKLRMVKHFAELAVCNLDAVMKDDSLSDKEYNNIREAHDSIASTRDTIERLTKPQRMVSAEAKENGYSEPEELTEFEQRIMRLVNRSTFQRRTVDEDGARYVAGLLLPYAKKQLEKQSEQKHALDIEIPFGAKDSELQEATYLIPEGFHAEIKDDEVLIKKGKQEPAWTKMDEEILSNAIFFIRKYQTPTRDKTMLSIAKEAEDWLKSLKQRIGG